MITNRKKVLIIVGPTAIGKTQLSLQIASRMNGEIVSADSRQIYKFMDIGTAKPTLEEQQQVVHYFIDIKFPDEYYSAGRFGKEARAKIDEIFLSGKQPIVVGGSGLYIRALVDGLFEAQISDPLIKQKLKSQAKCQGLNYLFNYLTKVDSTLAKQIHPNDSQRIIRALEVWEITGTPLSYYQRQEETKANFKPIFIGLNMDRKKLYQKIESRVDKMIQQGFVDEVARLLEMGYSSELNSLQTVGYKEVFEYFKGNLSFEEMISLIKQRSRNYAKRQLTWFRKDSRITWWDIDEFKNLTELVNKTKVII